MFTKILIGIAVLFVGFLAFVATRESKFHYERSGIINAPPEVIFPYISNLKLGSEWSPYEKKAPDMKKTFAGTDGQVGSSMEFEEDSNTGSGRLEILKIVPNESVEIRLLMTKPMAADNLIQYKLTKEGEGTKFTWSMSGEGGFVGKLITVLIDCEKMIGGQISEGIDNLKNLIENKVK